MSRVEQRRLEISKNGKDYEATSAFNTALDAFVKVVEAEEAHVLDNTLGRLRTPDFNAKDHPDSHIDENEDVDDEYYQDGNEVEKEINAEKVSPEESEDWIRKSDVEASIQKIEHHLSAIHAEYTKLKGMAI